MDKIELVGTLKVKSSMDLNTYVFTNKNGRYIGELSISDMAIQERLEKVFISRAKAEGELRINENHIKGGLKASITMEISSK